MWRTPIVSVAQVLTNRIFHCHRQGSDVYDAVESAFRFVPSNLAAGNKLGVPSAESVISSTSIKLYSKFKTRLNNGLCKYSESFYYGLQSLLATFDLSKFFGNMGLFFDAHGLMAHALGTGLGFDGLRKVEPTPSPCMRVDTYLLNSNQVCLYFCYFPLLT